MQDKLFFNPNQEEREAVIHLRHVFAKELERHPRINTHWYLLRFVRARQGKMKKVEKMFSDYLKWRDSEIVRDIDQYSKKDLAPITDVHVRGIYGTTKEGMPIAIERINQTDIPSFLNPELDDLRKDYFFNMYERFLHIVYPMASEKKGKRIDGLFVIYDLKGVNFSRLFNSNFKKYIKFLIGLVSSNYPEILSKMFIVNASSSFLFIWSIMKWWMDKVTRNKIEVHKGTPLDKFEKYIDINQIPDFFGGNCKEKLEDNHGPWKEMVDRSYKVKSFDLEDRTPEYQYYYTKEEYEQVQKSQKKKSKINTIKTKTYEKTNTLDMSYRLNTEGGIGKIHTLTVRIKQHTLKNIKLLA